MLLRRDAAYVTSAILPIRNVNLTLLPIDRIVLILKAELFLRTTAIARSTTGLRLVVKGLNSNAHRSHDIASDLHPEKLRLRRAPQ